LSVIAALETQLHMADTEPPRIVALPPDHDIARAPVGFIRSLLDRTGATLLHALLRSVDETGSPLAGLTSDELT
jgi:hypothetical protein